MSETDASLELVPPLVTDDQIREAYAAGMKAVPGSTGRPCDKQDIVFMRAFLRALATKRPSPTP